MNNPTMKDLANKVRSIEYKNAIEAIDETYESLAKNIPKAVLPEEVFKEHFLDFFMNPDKYKNTPILAQWISIAGGPYNEVDIIDREGKVIFTAPSAVMRPLTDFDKLSNINFHKVAVTYNNKKRITSAQATNYITTVLAGIDQSVHANIKEYIMRWDQIFDRYKGPAIDNQQQPEIKTTSPVFNKQKPDNDIFEF